MQMPGPHSGDWHMVSPGTDIFVKILRITCRELCRPGKQFGGYSLGHGKPWVLVHLEALLLCSMTPFPCVKDVLICCPQPQCPSSSSLSSLPNIASSSYAIWLNKHLVQAYQDAVKVENLSVLWCETGTFVGSFGRLGGSQPLLLAREASIPAPPSSACGARHTVPRFCSTFPPVESN